MEFIEKIEQWKHLFRTKRDEADLFYYNSLFGDVIDCFLKKSEGLRRYRYLISLLGYSPQPVILLVRAINPEKVLFIHSEETESYLDVIQKWTDLTLTRVLREQVDSSDPTGVYKAIKEFVHSRNPREILLDITGGKKAMVGGAAMAGNFLGMDTGYVDYERYLPDLRQPEPGSEFPNILKNPFYVLGDLELEKAKEAFNQLNFNRCIDLLNELNQIVEDIWGVRKLRALAEIYQEVDTFNFEKASSLIQEFLSKWRDDQRFVLSSQVEITNQILAVLMDTQHPDHHLFACLNYYFAGERFAQRARFDVATFLMYRTIEMILSLTLKEIGIEPSRPNYPPWVSLDQYQEKLREVFEREYVERTLPYKVGLMDSAILLSMNRHPIVEGLNLRELKGVITLRNESHFTHGSRHLSEEDYNKIRRFTRKLLEKCLFIKEKPPVKDFENKFCFPQIKF